LISEEQRSAERIDRLPQNLGEALDALRKDTVLLEAMGAELAKSYIAVRQHEWDNLKDLNLEEEVEMLAERY
jgi:glutamine synthetase